MSKKSFFDDISSDIDDIISKKFQYTSTQVVPSRHDTNMTFDRGVNKIGKILNTCVLYVDIRDSVNLNKKHSTETMGRIYSIFAKSVLKAAKHHSGDVRNIIGDRVMIVFPEDNCFLNAVNCSITINQICSLINKKFTNVNFKCGIGIDYGTMRVIKVGLHRQGTSNIENKSLVWVGKPANFASRLTDVAGKTINSSSVKVTYNPHNFSSLFDLSSILGIQPQKKIGQYLDTEATSVLTNEEFAKKLNYNNLLGITYSGGKLIRFDKLESSITFPTILMTEAVYDGFKKAEPTSSSIVKNLWKKIQNHEIKDVKTDIFGGNIIWII